jgi:hypothetical protein
MDDGLDHLMQKVTASRELADSRTKDFFVTWVP